jgi:hypothetical protein
MPYEIRYHRLAEMVMNSLSPEERRELRAAVERRLRDGNFNGSDAPPVHRIGGKDAQEDLYIFEVELESAPAHLSVLVSFTVGTDGVITVHDIGNKNFLKRYAQELRP